MFGFDAYAALPYATIPEAAGPSPSPPIGVGAARNVQQARKFAADDGDDVLVLILAALQIMQGDG